MPGIICTNETPSTAHTLTTLTPSGINVEATTDNFTPNSLRLAEDEVDKGQSTRPGDGLMRFALFTASTDKRETSPALFARTNLTVRQHTDHSVATLPTNIIGCSISLYGDSDFSALIRFTKLDVSFRRLQR